MCLQDISDWENHPFTMEEVRDRFSEITDWTDAVFPDDVKGSGEIEPQMQQVLANLKKPDAKL